MYWHIEDVIMEFLPPRSERGMSYCYWHKRVGRINSRAARILEDPFFLQGFLDILSGLDEFMKE
jgi:hypothetical protein